MKIKLRYKIWYERDFGAWRVRCADDATRAILAAWPTDSMYFEEEDMVAGAVAGILEDIHTVGADGILDALKTGLIK